MKLDELMEIIENFYKNSKKDNEDEVKLGKGLKIDGEFDLRLGFENPYYYLSNMGNWKYININQPTLANYLDENDYDKLAKFLTKKNDNLLKKQQKKELQDIFNSILNDINNKTLVTSSYFYQKLDEIEEEKENREEKLKLEVIKQINSYFQNTKRIENKYHLCHNSCKFYNINHIRYFKKNIFYSHSREKYTELNLRKLLLILQYIEKEIVGECVRG